MLQNKWSHSTATVLERFKAISNVKVKRSTEIGSDLLCIFLFTTPNKQQLFTMQMILNENSAKEEKRKKVIQC